MSFRTMFCHWLSPEAKASAYFYRTDKSLVLFIEASKETGKPVSICLPIELQAHAAKDGLKHKLKPSFAATPWPGVSDGRR